MIKFRDPKKALAEMVEKFNRERPKSRQALRSLIFCRLFANFLYRLLKETGRYSNSPVFVVGIYTGPDQLGEGFGSSLKMAEYRVRYLLSSVFCIFLSAAKAAEDALHRVYLTLTPSDLLQLPTSTFPTGTGDIFQDGTQGAYEAPELATSEIMYASSGRTGLVSASPPA